MALVIEFGCERAMDAPVPAGSSAPDRDAARRARGEAASTEAADRGTTETTAAAGAKTPAVPEGDGPPSPSVGHAPAPGASPVADSSEEHRPPLTIPAAGELEIVDAVVGTGPVAERGSEVAFDYRLALLGGRVVERSESGAPLRFRLGSGELIAGFEQGVEGMRIGGTRQLRVPAHLAWGQRGKRDPETGDWIVPPGATVEIEVTLVEVAP